MNVAGGATDVTTYFTLRLKSNGDKATGLVMTNLTIAYTRTRAAVVTSAVTALAAATTAHTDNKAIAVSDANQPGVIRVDWPDAAFATGVAEVILTVSAPNIFSEDMRVSIDPPVDISMLGGNKQSMLDLKDFADAGYDPITNAITDLATLAARTLPTAQYATAAALQVINNFIDTEIGSIISTIGTILGYVDTEITTIITLLGTVSTNVDTANTNINTVSTNVNTVLTKVDTEVTTIIERTARIPDVPSAVGSAMALSDNAIDAATLTAAAANKLADHYKRRTQANTEGSADGDALSVQSIYGGLQQVQNSMIVDDELTIFQIDGTTALGTRVIVSAPSADDIIGIHS